MLLNHSLSRSSILSGILDDFNDVILEKYDAYLDFAFQEGRLDVRQVENMESI